MSNIKKDFERIIDWRLIEKLKKSTRVVQIKLEEKIELWWARLSYQGKNEIAENLGYTSPDEMWESLEFGIKLDVFNEENSCRKDKN